MGIVNDQFLNRKLAENFKFSFLPFLQAVQKAIQSFGMDAFSILAADVIGDDAFQPAWTALGSLLDGIGNIIVFQVDHDGIKRPDDFDDPFNIGSGFFLGKSKAHHRFTHWVLKQDAVKDIDCVLFYFENSAPQAPLPVP